ncbi:hypothetical protein KY327_03325 [Candidatus Woesearchaeota archaeon]|nr:hypothetical protein [Candidatus Woesearchaeota archaeon]
MRTERFLTVLALAAIILIPLLTGLGMDSGPSINPDTTTKQDLICTWTGSPDTTSQDVTWYNSSTVYSGPEPVSFNQNQSSIPAYTARKGENWTCEVTLDNGTDTQAHNTSIIIKNALPTAPNATDETLYEDRTREIVVESTDADGDTIRYSKLYPSEPEYCEIEEYTGIITCNPTESDIGLSNATWLSSDGDPDYIAKANATYTVMEVNDPPTASVSDQTINEGDPFRYNITVSDEEDDFPIDFTVESDLPSIDIIRLSDRKAQVLINHSGSDIATFSDVGTWQVRVNLTDNGSTSSTPYDNPNASVTFDLTVISTNHDPNITTDFTTYDIAGTQGEQLEFYVNATDIDVTDTLNFGITSNCSLTNPWDITRINGSPDNASGKVNETLTNSHIACRWVNVTVNDNGGGSTWEMVFLNLTNTNDNPTIQELSFYSGNNGGDNMSNLTTVKGMEFWYRVNATDPDQQTYEGEVFTFSDNSTNDIMVNESTGVLSFMPDDSHIGNHLIRVNVTDDQGLWGTRDLHLEVKNNTAPQIQPIGDVTCQEDFPCQLYVEATDPDPGEDLVFSSNNTDVFDIQDYNETAWELSYTPTNAQVGSYAVNVTVEDRYGFTDVEVFNLTINNTNDAPSFDPVDLGTVVVDYPVNKVVDVMDEDVDIGLDNLSYDWEFLKDDDGLNDTFSFIEERNSSFTIGFTPDTSHVGTYWVNLSVTDIGNLTHWENVSFEVLAKTSPPEVEEVMPYWNATANRTELGVFGNASLFSDRTVAVNVSENMTVTFDALVTNDTAIANNSLTYEWFVDGQTDTTLQGVNPGSNSSLDISYGFFDSGDHEVAVRAIDERYASTNWTWDVTVTDVNRPPELRNDVDNVTLNTSTTISHYMSYRYNHSTRLQLFYDPDDDPDGDGERGEDTGEGTSLTYSVAPGYACTIASLSFSGDDLGLTPEEEGTCIIKFRATDPAGEFVDSNNVWITVTSVQVEEVETPVSSGGGATRPRPIPYPFEEPVESPYPIELITPEEVFTYVNESVEVPLQLANTWNESLTDVTLNATTANSSDDINFSFSKSHFPTMATGENHSVTLTIDGYRQEGPLSVVVSANVEDPEYVDSATIMINAMEQKQSGDDVESKVTFARDLLNENPECQELNELLNEAEKKRQAQQYEEAIKLINGAVDGCKYLINHDKEPTSEQPKDFFAVMTLSPKQLPALIIGAVIILSLLVFGVMMIISGRRGGKYDI